MNCQDISLFLDERDLGGLTTAETEAVEAHLRGCEDCATAWRVHERLRARAVPEMSADLAQRVWQSLPASAARARSRRRFGRTALLGFVLVGAAAAMTALQLRELATAPAEGWVPAAIERDVDLANDSASSAAPPAPDRSSAVASDSAEAGIAPADPVGDASVAGPLRRRLVVLPTRHENARADAVAAVDATYDVIVQLFRSKPDLEVVEVTESQVAAMGSAQPEAAEDPRLATSPPRTSVAEDPRPATSLSRSPTSVSDDPQLAASPSPSPTSVADAPRLAASPPATTAAASSPGLFPPPLSHNPYEGPWIFLGPPQLPGGEDLATARFFGGEYVLRVTNVRLSDDRPVHALRSPDDWSVEVEFQGPQGGGRTGAFAPQTSTPESVGTAIASRLYASLFPESARAEQESAVIDGGASESARAEALLALSLDRELSDSILEAAIELGRTAVSAEARRQVWELLGRSGRSAAVQPLTDALLFDPDIEVRREAADALFRHLDDPVVRSVLESASLNDPSPIVRLQARWQYMTSVERRTQVAAALRDRTLTPEERIAPLRVARRAVLSFDMDLRLDDELRSLLLAAARESGDPASRKAAVDELLDPASNAARATAPSADPAFVDFLVETLADDDVHVRTAAIHAARAHFSNARVRAALEAARATETDSQARIVLDEMFAAPVTAPATH